MRERERERKRDKQTGNRCARSCDARLFNMHSRGTLPAPLALPEPAFELSGISWP